MSVSCGPINRKGAALVLTAALVYGSIDGGDSIFGRLGLGRAVTSPSSQKKERNEKLAEHVDCTTTVKSKESFDQSSLICIANQMHRLATDHKKKTKKEIPTFEERWLQFQASNQK